MGKEREKLGENFLSLKCSLDYLTGGVYCCLHLLKVATRWNFPIKQVIAK